MPESSIQLIKSKPQRHLGWQLGRNLGSQGFTGPVRLAKHAVTGNTAAIKISSKKACVVFVGDDMSHAINEGNSEAGHKTSEIPRELEIKIAILKLIKHPNIINLLDVHHNPHEVHLVLEFEEGQELYDYVNNKGALPEEEAVRIFRQIIAGVEYLHRFSICHRHLKPENILLDSNHNVKITGFGMATFQPAGRWLNRSCGSPHYAPPEIVYGRKYRGEKADIWSCGVILYALLTCSLPFDGKDIASTLRLVKKGEYMIPSFLSDESISLLRRMLQKGPENRISAHDVLLHPLLTKYERLHNTMADYYTGPRPDLPVNCETTVSFGFDVDLDVFRSLQTFWYYVKPVALIERLTCSNPTPERVFYNTLKRTREMRDESHEYLFEDSEIDSDKSQTRSRKRLKRVIENWDTEDNKILNVPTSGITAIEDENICEIMLKPLEEGKCTIESMVISKKQFAEYMIRHRPGTAFKPCDCRDAEVDHNQIVKANREELLSSEGDTNIDGTDAISFSSDGNHTEILTKEARSMESAIVVSSDRHRPTAPRDIPRSKPMKNLECIHAEDYSVGIVCALPLELLAVRALFDRTHPDLQIPAVDSNHYALGSIGQHLVVSACLPDGGYGTNSAADVTANLRRSFPSVKFCLLVGIGGGVPSSRNDIRLGDVVVSKPTGSTPGVIQYDMVKTLENGVLEQNGSLQAPPRLLMTALSNLKSDPELSEEQLQEYIEQIVACRKEYRDPGSENDRLFSSDYVHNTDHATCDSCSTANTIIRPRRLDQQPRIHYGLIASGNKVMKNAKLRDEWSERNVLCFEMEAAGVMNTLPCLVIRGICDYSDSHKNKMFQKYAAATAASYAKLLLSYVRDENDRNCMALQSRKDHWGPVSILRRLLYSNSYRQV